MRTIVSSLFVLTIMVCLAKRSAALKLTIGESINGRAFGTIGSTLMLTCRHDSTILSGQPLEWYIPKRTDIPIKTTDTTAKHYISLNTENDGKTVSLFVRNFDNSDVGQYSCKYFRREGSNQILLMEVKVGVTVMKSIYADNCPAEQWIPEKTTGHIKCSISGLPPPTVTWLFGSKTIMTGSRYSYQSWALIINDITFADAGVYTVMGRQTGNPNIFQRDITVRVYTKPVITFGPQIVGPYPDVVIERFYAELQCLATGVPQPTIHWYRNKNRNIELQNLNPKKFFVNTNGRVGKLRIDYPIFPDDDDIYICQASVSSRLLSDDINMKTEKNMKVMVTVPARFLNYDAMYKHVSLGETGQVECKVYASKPLLLQFQKYNTINPYVLGVQPEDPRISVTYQQDPLQPMEHILRLTIQNTVFTDSWNYSCIATNAAANYTMNATLSVDMKPNMTLTDVSDRFGWINNSTNLTCISEGLPHPTWTWYRRLAPIRSNLNITFHIITWDFERYSVSWLQIRPLRGDEHWIYDEYRCKANNYRGESTRTIYFRRSYVPGSPVVRMVELTSSSVELNVTAAQATGGMPVEYFEVVYRGTGGRTAWYGPVIFPLDSNLRLTGLVSSTGYIINVYSRSFPGRSELPTLVSVTTKDQTIPEYVTVISPRKSSYPYAYFLRWKVPLNGGNPLSGYRILLRTVSCDNATFHVKAALSAWKKLQPGFFNPNMNEYRLLDLNPDTFYQVNIRAFNVNGYSPLLRETNSTSPGGSLDEEGNFVFWTPDKDALGRPARIRGRGGRHSVSVVVVLVAVCFVTASVVS